MKIDYTLTKEDYIAYNIHHIEHSPTLKRSINIQRYGLALIFLIFPFIIAGFTQIPLQLWLIVYGTVFIVWIRFYPKYFVNSTKKRILRLIEEGNNSSLFGPRSIIMTEEGVEEISEQGESRVTWNFIDRIEETQDYIYIYTSSVNAYVVPVRAFQNILEKNAFMEILKSKKEDKLRLMV